MLQVLLRTAEKIKRKLPSKEASELRMVVTIDRPIKGVKETTFEVCLSGKVFKRKRFVRFEISSIRGKSFSKKLIPHIVVRCSHDAYAKAGSGQEFNLEFRFPGYHREGVGRLKSRKAAA